MVAVAFLSNRLLLQKSILGNGRFRLKAARDTNVRHAISYSVKNDPKSSDILDFLAFLLENRATQGEIGASLENRRRTSRNLHLDKAIPHASKGGSTLL